MADGRRLATERPASPEEAAALLRALGEAGRRVRVRGGGTKLDWGGGSASRSTVELETGGLDRDRRAQRRATSPRCSRPACRSREAQDAVRGARPDARARPAAGAGGATIGGIVATGDSGPLRHRYGGVRDLVRRHHASRSPTARSPRPAAR